MRLFACFLLLAAAIMPAAADPQQPLHLVRGMISSVDGQNDAPIPASSFHIQDKIYFFTEVDWDDASRSAGAHPLQYKWYSGDKMVLSFDGSQTPDSAPYHWFAYVSGGHLGQGHHRAELYVDGQLFDTREFDIIPDSVALPAALPAESPAQAGEGGLRNSIQAQGRDLLLKGDTAGFERLAEEFRRTRERTPAGVWKLELLYTCLRHLDVDGGDAQWARLDGVAAHWLEGSPRSPDAAVMAAMIAYRHAWAWRGEGYIKDVEDDRLTRYRDGIERARTILDDHANVAATNPEWDALRIEVAGEQGADSDELLQRAGAALEREPYYYRIHYAAARALLPRWGGSEELVKQYVQMALDHTRAKEGNQVYARIYFYLATHAPNPLDELNGTGAKWPAMHDSLEEIRRAWPDPYNLEIERGLTCYSGDAAAYRALGPRSGGPQAASVAWYDTPQWRRDCDDWAFKGKRFDQDVSLGQRAHNYSSFLRGLGTGYWLYTVLITVAALGLLELLMWRLDGGPQSQPPPVVTPWGGASFNPARYPRTYHFIGMAQPLGNHLAVAMVVPGGAAMWALASAPWGNPLEGLAVVGGLSVIVAAGLLALARNVTRRLALAPDAVELRGLFVARRLRRDQIAGYRLDVDAAARRAIVLVPDAAAAQPELRISAVARVDEDFVQWISSLPSLEERDGGGSGRADSPYHHP